MPPPNKENVVDFEQALQLVAAAAPAFAGRPAERLPLLDCAGRILAEPVLADRDQPAFDRSTRDGFAVRASDLASNTSLPVVGIIRAGAAWDDALPPGQALQIMTGAPIPQGADAVVMIEHVTHTAQSIQLSDGRKLVAGDNIVRRAAEAQAGTEVMSAGTLLGAAEIALAAFCGCPQLSVYSKPRVSIVSTGDELVELDQQPGPAQIRNSNSYSLAALVSACSATPQRLPIAADTPEALRAILQQARATADLIVLSGGVSMGEFDLVEAALAELDAEFIFTGVRMQPGKPVVFGRLPARDGAPASLFFGLPGNPVSTEVTFHCFAEPLLRMLAGAPGFRPRWAQATLAEAVKAGPPVTRLLPAHLTGVSLRVVPWQGSGDLAANARANCYAELLPGQAYTAGEVVRILLR